jgi:hypothetical protein
MKKFVYTFWTKPFFINNNLYSNIVYLLLSIELVKKISSNIEIHTDEYGELILKKFFNDIDIKIDILKNIDFHVDRWSIPKLYTINSQKEPFCHIDHDVFLWEETPIYDSIDIVSQSYENEFQKEFNDPEFFSKFYKELFVNYISYNDNIEPIFAELLLNGKYAGYNCGFLDIYNVDASKKWTDFAIKLNSNYKNNFRPDDCAFVEQLSLYIIANKFNFKMDELIPIIKYETYGRIDLKSGNNLKYTHLMGSKKDPLILNYVEKKLKNINESLYKKLSDNSSILFKNKIDSVIKINEP